MLEKLRKGNFIKRKTIRYHMSSTYLLVNKDQGISFVKLNSLSSYKITFHEKAQLATICII